MTDARLRELERCFRETRSIEDETAWLAERVRAGELARERVELAALVGHPAARSLVTVPPIQLFEPEAGLTTISEYQLHGHASLRSLESSLEGADDEDAVKVRAYLFKPGGYAERCQPDPAVDQIHGLGKAAAVRAALAAARATWPVWIEQFHADSAGEEVADVRWGEWTLRAAQAWVVCPCQSHFEALQAYDAEDPGREALATHYADTLAQRISKAYKYGADKGIASYVAIAGPRWLVGPVTHVEWHSGGAAGPPNNGMGLRSALNGAAFCVGTDSVRAALREELVPWALRYGDPVAARLSAL